jgi:hypothetical protein
MTFDCGMSVGSIAEKLYHSAAKAMCRGGNWWENPEGVELDKDGSSLLNAVESLR